MPWSVAKEITAALSGAKRSLWCESSWVIDAATAGHLWAERFDGQWADVFALQDKVVTSIAGALKLRLMSSQGKSDFAGGTNNPAAYDA